MKLTLTQTTLILVALFTLSFTALGSESNKTPTTVPGSESSQILNNKKVDAEPTSVDTNVIPMADKILAEQAEIDARIINDSLRGASNSLDKLRSAANAESDVSQWLEDHATHAHSAAEAKTSKHSHGEHSHVDYEEIELDMGGGWCDLCGCWMRHGSDPNGTPQEQIGHSFVCTGGFSTQSCSSHYYRNCFSS
jgi:hypothetical protein